MGVDIIEAGFPIASEGDFAAVHEIAKRAKNAVICGLSRAALQGHRPLRRGDQAGQAQAHPHLPLHLAGAHEVQAAEGAARGLRDGDRAGDARAQPHRRRRMVGGGRHPHRARFPLPLRRGRDQGRRHHHQHPRHRRLHDAGGIFRRCSRWCASACRIPTRRSSPPIATTISAWRSPIRSPACRAGARQIECTINGIGERAGNAALEEIVMAMQTRNDVLPFWTGIDATMLTRASKLVSAVTSFPVQYNKAIVGRNAFAHESGIHQDGMLKNAQTYEIMTPEIGRRETDLAGDGQAFRPPRLRAQAGGARLSARPTTSSRTPSCASRRWPTRRSRSTTRTSRRWSTRRSPPRTTASRSLSLTVIAGTMGPQSATLTLDIDGKHVTTQSTGNGPVDAIFNAIHALVPHEATLELYQVHAVTEGTDAQAEVSVRLVGARARRSPPRAPIPTRWSLRPRPISARSTSSPASATRRRASSSASIRPTSADPVKRIREP